MTGASSVREAPAEAWSSFGRHRAYIVGIDDYRNGISPLQTAAADAVRLAEVLQQQHRFDVHPPLIDAQASAAGLRQLLLSTMPTELGPDDRALFYFAGHGVAADGDDGPAGFLVPSDAHPGTSSTLLPMAEVLQALDALPCRHLLVILDCCFSGAFRWASQQRAVVVVPKRLYQQRFARFVADKAWQVITSAACDQKALDVLGQRALGDRGVADASGLHSPFAQRLFQALEGAADACQPGESQGDGIITATELYLFLRNTVETDTEAQDPRLRQTPSFFPLPRHDKGEFIFLHPRHALNLPRMKEADSPYKGLQSFDPEDAHLFYGRERVVAQLLERARDDTRRLLVVTGASGSGKSSVVKAGLLPLLQKSRPGLNVLAPMRPGDDPLAALQKALAHAPPNAVLVIDQLEEVITRSAGPASTTLKAFDAALAALLAPGSGVARLIVTVRSDFEPQFSRGLHLGPLWAGARYTVPPFTTAELREVVQMPALQATMNFEPPGLVDRIVDEVAQSVGAIPLLSFALSEMFRAYLQRVDQGRADRTLTQTDLDRLGGVVGAMTHIADRLYDELAHAGHQQAMRCILLRMVSLEGELAGRRVAVDDLAFDEGDAAQVASVIDRLVDARLVVRLHEGCQDCVEPAHDALVRAWPRLREWIDEAGRDHLMLLARVAAAVDEARRAETARRRERLLWTQNPNLYPAQRALEAGLAPFNRRERQFIRDSTARREQADQAAREAATTARAGELAALAASMVASYPDRAVLVAIESVRLRPTPLGAALIAAARSDTPYRRVLRCRAGLRQAQLSPDGRTVLTEGENGRIMLWNAQSGAEVPLSKAQGTPKVWANTFRAALLSPEGGMLVTAEFGGTVRTWDAASGRQRLHIGDADARSILCSPDGRCIAVLNDREPGQLRILDASTGQTLQQAETGAGRPHSMQWLPDGSGVLVLTEASALGLWTFEGGWRELLRLSAPTYDIRFQPSQDAGLLLLATPSSTQVLGMPHAAPLLTLNPNAVATLTPAADALITVEREAGPDGHRTIGRIHRLHRHAADAQDTALSEARVWRAGPTRALVVCPQGRQFAALRNDGLAELHDGSNGDLLAVMDGHEGGIAMLRFSADGSRMVTVGHDGTARIWNDRGRPLHVLRGHEAPLADASITPDGSSVMTQGRDATVRLWSLDATRAQRTVATSEKMGVLRLRGFRDQLSADGRLLVTWDQGSIKLFDGTSESAHRSLETGRNDVSWAQPSADGQRVLSVAGDGTAQLWDMASGALLQVLQADGGRIEAATLAPDGRWILARCGCDALLWEAGPGSACRVLKGHPHPLTLAQFAVDGRTLITADEEGAVGLWDAETASSLAMLPMSEKPRGFTIDHKVERVALSRDGRRLLVSRWGRNQLLEAPSGKEVMALPQGEASLSPDGTLIAVCPKADGLLHVWQVDSGREKFTQMDRGQRCTGPVFSPDGRFLLAQCDGDKLVLRDVASGRMLRSLPLASGMAMTADFSADGSTLVAIIWSGNQYFVQFWPCHEAQPLEHLIEQERARIGRELTADEREMLGLPRGAAGR